MLELKSKLVEKEILKKLGIHQALSEVKLQTMLEVADSKDALKQFKSSLLVLLKNKIIEVVTDPTNSMMVYRMKKIFH